jgi:D-alanyl-D-alanine carboxypeptidase/D-alanyl-D-alanine-endopeptidase (penicillin-binding protein 4)
VLTLLSPAIAFAADLPARLDALVSAPAGARAAIGIHVVNVASGETLYAHGANSLYLPASNMKLFTAAVALTRLGPNYRFETRVLREASGDVVLVGSGDPSLSGRVYPYSTDARPANPLAAIESLAEQMLAGGLRRVDGNIVGDDQRYPWAPYPPSWTEDDVQHAYGAPVSALTLNDNVITIRALPGARAGELAHVSIHPPIEYFALDNRITTTADGTASAHFERVPGTRQVLLTGSIGIRSGGAEETLAVDDPALFTAQALYDALLRSGVAIHGRPVARHRMIPGAKPQPQGEVLATRTSPPLSELLQAFIKVSQNLHAELALREVAFMRKGDGTLDAGFSELLALLNEVHISPVEWRTEDGSGLARNDEVTPAAITRLLRYMENSPNGSVWHSLFPIGGQDGTLGQRLCCTSDGSRIRAKTGTLTRSVALSGYADSRSHGKLAFSILVNNFAAPAPEVRDWVDKIALELVQ